MTLGQAQREFALDIAHLIFHAYEMGYEISFGDAYRDPRVHGEYGIKGSYASAKSEHKRRLAIDLNLFKDGKYLPKTEDHKALGHFWKSLRPENVWGGDFSNPDGNHYQRDL